jgi:4-amino-4-deoxy-L-arabinose transferase-like glycosyltransferase
LQTVHLNKRQEYIILCLLTIIACLLRLFLILHDWPGSNSDEATTGLMALHIAQGKDFPIFIYGQGYMGTLQAYLGSILFHLFGVSLHSLRFGLILIFAAFLVTLYFLVKTIYSRAFAFLCLLLYTTGSSIVIGTEIFSSGSYAETLLFSVLIFLLVAHMILPASQSDQQTPPMRRRRLLHWGILGFIAGLAIYSDIVILPTLVCCSLLLYLFARHELFSRAGLLMLGGLLLALIPTIIYNLSVPFPLGTIAAYAGSSGYAATTTTKGGITFAQQFLQALLITLPDATGLSNICYIHEPMHAGSSLFDIFEPQQQSCALASIAWTTGYITLGLLAATQTVRTLIFLRQQKRLQCTKIADALHRERTLYWIRLMLLMSGALTFMLYVISAPAALNPRTTARYLFTMLIVMSTLIWPLWQSIQNTSKTMWHKRIIPLALLLFICLLFFQGTVDIMSQLNTYQTTIAQQQTLIQFLRQQKMTRFYSDYWTCNNLIFQSQEQLLCANLDDHLQTGQDRYLPYREAVRAQSQAVYVFKAHSVQATLLAMKIKQHPQVNVNFTLIDDYIVYHADKPIHTLP